MKHSTLFTALVAIIALMAGTHVQADRIIAVSWGGDAYTIDSLSGSGAFLGPTGSASLNSMAKDRKNGFYYSTSGGDLLRIDPVTGAATVVAAMSGGVNSVRGMAFLNGRLYLLEDQGSADDLYTVDPNTGITNFIGATGRVSLQGLAASPSGRLYAWDLADGLFTVNPATGTATDVDPTTPGRDMQCLAFDCRGNLFGCRDELYRISTVDGSWGTVGSGGYTDVRGMEFTDPRVRINGNCPGVLTLSLDLLTPGGGFAVVYGPNQAPFVIPPGFTCEGIELCVAPPRVVFQGVADGNGRATVTGNAPPNVCGGFIQIIDGRTCCTSNVAQIP